MHSDSTFAPHDAAAWLMREHSESRPFAPFAAARSIRTLEQAYAVQDAYVSRCLQQRRTGRSGYKIGLTSLSMQAMCGIDSPVAGVILSDRALQSGATLRSGDYGRCGVEFEIAVRIGRDLQPGGPVITLEDVEAAVEAVAPAIEVVDDRNCDYASLDVLSLVADNAWNAGVVLGEFRTSWPSLDGVQGRVWNENGPLDTGRGRDVLGHPFQPVAWLANHLRAGGRQLRAGDIVMTGSMVTTKFPRENQRYRFEIDDLGAVDVVFERQEAC